MGGRGGRRLHHRRDVFVGRGGADRARRHQAGGPAGRRSRSPIHQARARVEGWTAADACRRLEEAGADVVGLNCIRGPRDDAAAPARDPRCGVDCHVAGLPVPYRTTDAEPTFQSLPTRSSTASGRPAVPGRARPVHVHTATRSPTSAGRRTTRRPLPRRVLRRRPAPHPQPGRGARPQPPASRYTADMSKHAYPRHRSAREAGVQGGLRPQAVERL